MSASYALCVRVAAMERVAKTPHSDATQRASNVKQAPTAVISGQTLQTAGTPEEDQ